MSTRLAGLIAPLALLAGAGLASAQKGHGGGGGAHMSGGGVHMSGGARPGNSGYHGGGNTGGYRGGSYATPYRGGGYGGYPYGYSNFGSPYGGRGYGGLGYGYGLSNGYGYGLNSGYGYGLNSGYGYGLNSGYGYGLNNGYGYGLNSGYGGTRYSSGYLSAAPAVLGVPSFGDPAPSGPAFSSSAEPAPATLSMTFPDGAQVWVDGKETPAPGGRLTFTSPVLQPGTRATVNVKARWNDSTREMNLPITAGDKMSVDLRNQ